jgi:hypothetical protein
LKFSTSSKLDRVSRICYSMIFLLVCSKLLNDYQLKSGILCERFYLIYSVPFANNFVTQLDRDGKL